MALKGRDQDGHFRTSVAKIYPVAMNSAIADAVAQFVRQTFEFEVPPAQALDEDLRELCQMDFVSKAFVQPDCYLE